MTNGVKLIRETDQKLAILLQKVASFFALGNIQSINEKPLGHTNDSHIVVIETGEMYVIRIFRRFDRNLLANEYHIQCQLRAQGLLSNYLLTASDGGVLYANSGHYASVSKYIPGEHPEHASPATCREIGKYLARLHILIDGLPYVNERMFVGLERVRSLVGSVASEHHRAQLGQLMDFSSNIWGEDVPKGVIHGDLHASNVLVASNAIAVLDLESAGEGPYVLDIARAAVDICRNDNRLNESKIAGFLQGYESQRKLATNEKI
jgi:homoserine kinase type II